MTRYLKAPQDFFFILKPWINASLPLWVSDFSTQL